MLDTKTEPGKEICDRMYSLTSDYLTDLAKDDSDFQKIFDVHDRLCEFLQSPQFHRFRISVGNLIWVSWADSVYANWLEIGKLRDQVIFAQNPHRNRNSVILLIWALRSRMELARKNDLPFLESRFA